MKKLVCASLFMALFVLTGCGAAANSPEASWNALVAAAEAKNCDEFRKHVTERFKMTENDCAKAFKSFEENGTPVVNWDETKYNEDNTTAKVYLENGRSLTTFIKKDDLWQADTKFWR